MTRTTSTRGDVRGQQGFTLIELLVVILIIGILASIALPAFLAQRHKGQDAAAKSQVRNMVSQIEACFTEDDQYLGCTAALTSATTNLDVGPGIGQVRITAESTTGYTIRAISRASTNGTQHWYQLVHTLGSPDVKTCEADGSGGCPPGGNW